MAPLPGESRGVDPRFQYTRKMNRFSGEYRPGDAHNPELRHRVVREYQFKASGTGERRPHGLMAEIARDFKVDPATVKHWVMAWETEQRLDPLARGTTNYEKVQLEHLRYLQFVLQKDPTRYLWELRTYMADDLKDNPNVQHPLLSESTVWRLVKDDLGLSHKKLSVIASQQMTAENQARREAYHAEVLVADETAFSYNTGWRRNGWASAHGETRAVDIQPKIYAPSHSCVGILSVDGFEHFKIKQGAISGEDWWQCNCEAEPVFASGKFRRLIVDNASVHRMMGDQVKWFLQDRGITLTYLPPYSPDLSPIEEAFSKVKLVAKDGREDTRRDLEAAIARGFQSITSADSRGYFRLYL